MEIKAESEALKQASAIVIAEQGRWYIAIIRPLLAFLIVIYFWKVLVCDKVLGLGSTVPLTAWSQIGPDDHRGYVGGRSIEKVEHIFARRS